MGDDLELKVGANVRGVEDGGKKVDRTLDAIERSAGNLKKQLEAMGDGTNALRKLREEAEKVFRAFEKLKTSGHGSADSIHSQIADLNKQVLFGGSALMRPDKVGRGGGPGGPTIAPPGGGGGSGPGGGAAKGAGRMGFMSRLLIGNLASMGIGMGVYGGMQFLGDSLQEAGDERAAQARVRHQLDRTGRSGMFGGLDSNAHGLNRATGRSVGDIESLISRAMLGTKDLGNATRVAKLGMDIEAGGGGISADSFIKAFNSGGAEFVDRMKELARAEGVVIDEHSTMNSVLQKLTERFGGLSEKVFEAQGGISKLAQDWERIKVKTGNTIEPAAGYLADAMEGKHPKWEQYINNFLAPNQYALPDERGVKLLPRNSTPTAPTVDDDVSLIKDKAKSLKPAKTHADGKVVVEHKITFRNDPNAPTQMTARGM